MQTFKNVSRNTEQKMEAQQQDSVWPSISEEEELEEDSDNENGEREEDTNEDLQLARDVLRASDKFKDHRMRQVLQGAANDVRRMHPDDLTTSDIQDHLEDIVGNAQLQVDYLIELYTKTYINKTLARRKNSPNTTRDNFDLSDNLMRSEPAGSKNCRS
jgi:hypothetical protein